MQLFYHNINEDVQWRCRGTCQCWDPAECYS